MCAIAQPSVLQWLSHVGKAFFLLQSHDFRISHWDHLGETVDILELEP